MLPSHGANPKLLFEQLKIPMPNRVIDFSENVNIAGVPAIIRQQWSSYLPLLEKYPHPKGEPFLSAIAKQYQMKSDHFFIGNGAAEIFTLLANLWAKQRVIIVNPTFSEYEATLAAQSAEIIHIQVKDIATWELPMQQLRRQMTRAHAIYLCTPNNPTGVLPPREQLAKLIAIGWEHRCYVVLDEAFIDWVDEKHSFIKAVEHNPYVIVTRSMTKMYSLAGIRLGYAVASKKIIKQLNEVASHWHVNALAATIGVTCLEQHEYRIASISHAQQQRKKFEKFLRKLGCETTNSVTNYCCFKLPDPSKSMDFYLDMLLKGLVIRHSENYRGMDGHWFRVGMKTESEMLCLEEEMIEWFKQGVTL